MSTVLSHTLRCAVPCRRPSSGGMSSRDYGLYPIPIVPFLKCGSIRSNMMERLCALPDEVWQGCSSCSSSNDEPCISYLL